MPTKTDPCGGLELEMILCLKENADNAENLENVCDQSALRGFCKEGGKFSATEASNVTT